MNKQEQIMNNQISYIIFEKNAFRGTHLKFAQNFVFFVNFFWKVEKIIIYGQM